MLLFRSLHGWRRCPQYNKRPFEEKQVEVPLTGVIVNASVVDFLAEVSINQRYENTEDFPIEAIYPLGKNVSFIALFGLENWCKNRLECYAIFLFSWSLFKKKFD